MKITKNRLKQIIKEELSKLQEYFLDHDYQIIEKESYSLSYDLYNKNDDLMGTYETKEAALDAIPKDEKGTVLFISSTEDQDYIEPNEY
jgi:hypothetical protein